MGMGCLCAKCCHSLEDLSDMEMDERSGTNIEIYSGKDAFKLYAIRNNEIQSKISIPKLWIEGKHCTIHTEGDVEIKVEGTTFKLFDEHSSVSNEDAGEKTTITDNIGISAENEDVVDSAANGDEVDLAVSHSNTKNIVPILQHIDAKQKQDRVKAVGLIHVAPDLMKKCSITHYVSSSEFYIKLNENKVCQQFIEDEAKASITGPLRLSPNCELNSQCLLTEFAFDFAGSRSVISHIENDKITVKLLDIGSELVVTEDMLAGIPPKIDFSHIEAQAVKCCLYKYRDSDKEAADMLKYIAANETTINIHFIGCKKDTWHVSLIRTSNMLIKENEPIFMALGYTAQPALESSNVYIGYIDEVNRQLWLQKESESSVYDQLGELCAQKGNETEPLHAFNIGDPCLCKSLDDEGWYRAVICSYDCASDVCVQYIDFGNMETLPCQNIKSLLKDDVMRHHPLSYPCILKDGQTILDFTKMHQLLNVSLQVTVHRKLGAFFEVSLNMSEVNIIEKISPENGLLVQNYSPNFNEKVKFVVSHIEDNGSLWAQDLRESDSLVNVMECIGQTEEIPVEPAVGLFCCCKYSLDQAWYRAVILSVGDNLSVRFIDFGNSEFTTKDQLKPLDVESSCLSCQAVKSCFFDEIASEVLMAPSFASMEMFDIDGDYTARFLQHEEHGLVLSECKNQEGEILCDVLRKAMEETSIVPVKASNLSPFPFENNVEIPMAILDVESDGSFWVQNLDRDDERFGLSERIKNYIGDGTACKISCDIQPGMFCVAKYTDDMWYRCVVTDVQEDTCSVRFVDYGDGIDVDMSSLYVMPGDFASIPIFAIQCRFKRLKDSIVTNEIKEVINQLGNSKDTFIGQLEQVDGEVLLHTLTCNGTIIDETLLNLVDDVKLPDDATATFVEHVALTNGHFNGQDSAAIQEFEVGTWKNEEYSAIAENEDNAETPTSQGSFKFDSGELSESDNQKEVVFHSLEHSEIDSLSQDNAWTDIDKFDAPVTED